MTKIVLLILAVVTINAVKGDGIIQKAESATQKYNDAAVNEQAKIDSYIGTIKEFEDKAGGEEVTLLTFTMTDICSEDTKVYTYEEGMTWREWIDSKKYETERFSISGGKVMYLYTEDGWEVPR